MQRVHRISRGRAAALSALQPADARSVCLGASGNSGALQRSRGVVLVRGVRLYRSGRYDTRATTRFYVRTEINLFPPALPLSLMMTDCVKYERRPYLSRGALNSETNRRDQRQLTMASATYFTIAIR